MLLLLLLLLLRVPSGVRSFHRFFCSFRVRSSFVAIGRELSCSRL
jgi:hypothetical protein